MTHSERSWWNVFRKRMPLGLVLTVLLVLGFSDSAEGKKKSEATVDADGSIDVSYGNDVDYGDYWIKLQTGANQEVEDDYKDMRTSCLLYGVNNKRQPAPVFENDWMSCAGAAQLGNNPKKTKKQKAKEAAIQKQWQACYASFNFPLNELEKDKDFKSTRVRAPVFDDDTGAYSAKDVAYSSTYGVHYAEPHDEPMSLTQALDIEVAMYDRDDTELKSSEVAKPSADALKELDEQKKEKCKKPASFADEKAKKAWEKGCSAAKRAYANAKHDSKKSDTVQTFKRKKKGSLLCEDSRGTAGQLLVCLDFAEKQQYAFAKDIAYQMKGLQHGSKVRAGKSKKETEDIDKKYAELQAMLTDVVGTLKRIEAAKDGLEDLVSKKSKVFNPGDKDQRCWVTYHKAYDPLRGRAPIAKKHGLPMLPPETFYGKAVEREGVPVGNVGPNLKDYKFKRKHVPQGPSAEDVQKARENLADRGIDVDKAVSVGGTTGSKGGKGKGKGKGSGSEGGDPNGSPDGQKGGKGKGKGKGGKGKGKGSEDGGEDGSEDGTEGGTGKGKSNGGKGGTGDGPGGGTGGVAGGKKGGSKDGGTKKGGKHGNLRPDSKGDGPDIMKECQFLDFSDNPTGHINGSNTLPVVPSCIFRYTDGRPEYMFADSFYKDLSNFNAWTYMEMLRKTYVARLLVARRYLTGDAVDSKVIEKKCGISSQDMTTYLRDLESEAAKTLDQEGITDENGVTTIKHLMENPERRQEAWLLAKGILPYAQAAKSIYSTQQTAPASGPALGTCDFYVKGGCSGDDCDSLVTNEDRVAYYNKSASGVLSNSFSAAKDWLSDRFGEGSEVGISGGQPSGGVAIVTDDPNELLQLTTEFTRKYGRPPKADEVCTTYSAREEALKTAETTIMDAVEGNPYLLVGHDPDEPIFDLPAFPAIAAAANSADEAGNLKNTKMNSAVDGLIKKLTAKFDDDIDLYCQAGGKADQDSWYSNGRKHFRRLLNHDGLKEYFLSMFPKGKLLGCVKDPKPVGFWDAFSSRDDDVAKMYPPEKCDETMRPIYAQPSEYSKMEMMHECAQKKANKESNPSQVFLMAGCIIGMATPAAGGVAAGCGAYFIGDAAMNVHAAGKDLDEKYDCYTYMTDLCGRDEYLAAKEALSSAQTMLGVTVAVEVVGLGFILKAAKPFITKINKLVPRLKQANAAVEAAEIELRAAKTASAKAAAERKLARAKAARDGVEKQMEKYVDKVAKMHKGYGKTSESLANAYAPPELLKGADDLAARAGRRTGAPSKKSRQKAARKDAARKAQAARNKANPRDLGDVYDPMRTARDDFSPYVETQRAGEAMKRARARKEQLEWAKNGGKVPKKMGKAHSTALTLARLAADKSAYATRLLDDASRAEHGVQAAKAELDDLVLRGASKDEITRAEKAYDAAVKKADAARARYQKASKEADKANLAAQKAKAKYDTQYAKYLKEDKKLAAKEAKAKTEAEKKAIAKKRAELRGEEYVDDAPVVKVADNNPKKRSTSSSGSDGMPAPPDFNPTPATSETSLNVRLEADDVARLEKGHMNGQRVDIDEAELGTRVSGERVNGESYYKEGRVVGYDPKRKLVKVEVDGKIHYVPKSALRKPSADALASDFKRILKLDIDADDIAKMDQAARDRLSKSLAFHEKLLKVEDDALRANWTQRHREAVSKFVKNCK